MCLTILLACVAVCVTVIISRMIDEDCWRADKDNRRLRERAEKAEQAEADSRQAISGLLSENKRLLSIIKKKGYEKEN